ncbi:VanZ family protein [Luteolibacter pohnpeiensis]|uniref:VanZ family protein n=1 Tax=Luteolibacter pohnpeiensis TaxID=454153 RepID=A0A934VWJ1_9BACT|nr:VanZ family protein [Luteolibacter pohnpeiensis]MBK1882559.1 VanZ family protein [Luteolibacter pohnpeiensis]
MPQPTRHPLFWITAVLIWFGTLWWLSSSAKTMEDLPPIPNLDKILHFGYYFGGSGLMAAYLFCRQPEAPKWRMIILYCVVFIALVGASDEIHQNFVPGRSGLDPFDWMADISGGLCGALVFKRLHWLLK